MGVAVNPILSRRKDVYLFPNGSKAPIKSCRISMHALLAMSWPMLSILVRHKSEREEE